MKPRTKAILAVLTVVAGSFVWFFVLPAVRFSEMQKEFPLGMSFSNALTQIPQPFQVYTSQVAFPPGVVDLTEEQKRDYNLYSISAERKVELHFNHYGELTTVIPIGSPIDLWLWSAKRRSAAEK